MKHARYLVLAAFVALAGCDTAITDPDVVILNRELTRSGDGSPVTFAFEANSLTVGESKVLRCGCTVDLDRITSYNVCYTKLLRRSACPWGRPRRS